MAITVLFITASIAIATYIEKLIEVATIRELMCITAIVSIIADMAITGILLVLSLLQSLSSHWKS